MEKNKAEVELRNVGQGEASAQKIAKAVTQGFLDVSMNRIWSIDEGKRYINNPFEYVIFVIF